MEKKGIEQVNDLQFIWLKAKKEDKYGGYGSFIGMVWNKHIETGKDFYELLDDAITISLDLEQKFRDLDKPKKEY